MKINFTEKDRNKILASLRDAMGDRELAKIVAFNLKTGFLEVVISKLGTSTLQFAEQVRDNGIEYTLNSEKIALTHRAFKDDVTGKIMRVVEKAGGKVS